MPARSVLLILVLISLLSACAPSPGLPSQTNPVLPSPSPTTLAFPTSVPTIPPPAVTIVSPSPTPLSNQEAVLMRASEVIQLLKNQDLLSLANYVHPLNGLRFSPYAFVRDADLVFSADQVAHLPADSRSFTWGAFSGSGAPIDLGWPAYYAKFIYDQDFANAPQLSLNHRLGVSTSTDNSLEFYPSAMLVEYYFPGFDPQLQGMDWKSLRLVFTEYQGTWFLCGIIHDEWTT